MGAVVNILDLLRLVGAKGMPICGHDRLPLIDPPTPHELGSNGCRRRYQPDPVMSMIFIQLGGDACDAGSDAGDIGFTVRCWQHLLGLYMVNPVVTIVHSCLR